MSKIFLSHVAEDRSTAKHLVADLKDLGIDLWSDTQLSSGDSWENVIEDQIRQTEAIVVLVSPASLGSEWIAKEWAGPLSRSARIVPVLINGATFWHLPTSLRDIRVLDLNSYPLGLSELVDRLREVISSPIDIVAKSTERNDLERFVKDAVKREIGRLGLEPGKRRTPAPERSNSVFVVISFDEQMEPVFAAIKSAAQHVGLEAERIKDVRADFLITETILQKIESARLVVVDLTLERPNVYFELGYARGREKTVVTLLRSGAKAHVDVRGWNYIEYIDSRPLEEDLVDRFTAEISGDKEGN